MKDWRWSIILFDKDRNILHSVVIDGDKVIDALENYRTIYGWDDRIAGLDITKIRIVDPE